MTAAVRSLVALALSFAGTAGPAMATGAQVTIHADRATGPTNQRLGGMGWNDGNVEGVAALAPREVRIDARLEEASQSADQLDLQPLLDNVARVRAIGAVPLVILDYTPRWLGQPNAFGRDPTRVAPADLDAWEALIVAVVRGLATAGVPAYRFEVWNEPDLPVFWQDSPLAFLQTAMRTHRAVARVAAETNTPLEIGGPASLFPDLPFVALYARSILDAGLPLDFISWHYYANYPFIGPDGAEGTIPEPILPAYPIIGRRNPIASPVAYRVQVEMMRAGLAAALAGTGRSPELVIDEWNLSAGGFDVRHGTHEGAAFVAGSLVEMEAAGLDAADFYRAAGSADPGDWGLVRPDASVRPAWWVFDAWRASAGQLLAVDGADPLGGFWARASRSGNVVQVLLAAFTATGGETRTVSVTIAGCDPASATLRGLDAASSSMAIETEAPIAFPGGTTIVDVPSPSVRWLRISCAP